MNKVPWTKEEQDFAIKRCKEDTKVSLVLVLQEINRKFNRARTVDSLAALLYRAGIRTRRRSSSLPAEPSTELPSGSWKETRERDSWVIESTDSRICTVEDAIKKANVDLDIWEVERVFVGGWDVTMKLQTEEGDKPFRAQNQQIKVILRRKVPFQVEQSIERVLDRLKDKSPKVLPIKRIPIEKLPHRHSLEICLMDPHYGMRSFRPESDAEWSPDLCAQMVLASLDELIRLSLPFAPFEEVVMPMGNDFFHTDNLWQTTTAGTPQPEAEAYHHTFVGGEQLAIEIVDRAKTIAPVVLYSIPGNHDRTTSFMLGRVLRAYYKNDSNVTVHADASPYKFHRYGCNLIGYEHGHSVKPIRLAALMANECPEDWAATKHGYREWHLGDQHRKGSSNPSTFEEQGVSVEYLPGITAPNEWHRLKSYNWQKRASMAYVWSYFAGPISRLQVNVDRYLNALMGQKPAERIL